MSRKVPSFGQLIGYIDRDDDAEAYTLRHNLMGRDQDHIRTEFETNGSLLQKRKNGVYLYHEIISISRAEGLSPEDQKDRLYDIARTYVDARCPDNMVYGGLHADKDHSYHMHLMISANRAGDAKRLRLTKAQFREIQIQTERHVLEKYPELEQKVAIEKQSDRGRQKGEAELERRTGKRPKREEVLERVTMAFEASLDKQSLLDALGRENLELYVRGKNLGVIDHESGKRHRLKTLDLDMADRVAIRMEDGDRTQDPEDLKQEAELETDRQQDGGPDRVEPEQVKDMDPGLDEPVDDRESKKPAGEKEKGVGEEKLDERRRSKARRIRDTDRNKGRDGETVKRRDRSEKSDRQKQRKSDAQAENIREADNESYVKKDSSADLKQDPSKQDPKADQERHKPAGRDVEPNVDQPSGIDAETDGGSLLATASKWLDRANTAGKRAKHEIEEFGKVLRTGLTGQDEEIGKTSAEKEAEDKRDYEKDTQSRENLSGREQEKARAKTSDRSDTDQDRSDPKDQAKDRTKDPRDQWREEISRARDAGRSEDRDGGDRDMD